MNSEKVEVLKRIQNDEITAEEGLQLLEDLENGKTVEITKNLEVQKKDSKGKMFRVKIHSQDGDKVNIQIPLTFAKAVLRMGGGAITTKINSDINIDVVELLELIEQGNLGNLVDIESADGDTVQIVVE